MKKKIRFIVAIVVSISLITCFGCGKTAEAEGELDGSAVARDASEMNSSEVYLDDAAIALADEATVDQNYASAARAAFDQVNQLRAAAGLTTLTWSSDLESAARVRASEATGTFSHTRPNGSDWWTVDSRVMYGENLARAYYTAETVVDAWMASPTHKANIMKADFKTLSIAIVASDDGTWYWAQEFGY